MKWFFYCLEHSTDFKGRAHRTEYWMFQLFFILIIICASFLDGLFDTGYIGLFVGCLFILPRIAVSVRRLHDIGKSGWFYLIGLAPFLGGICLLILFCMDSEIGSNQWGPNPKEVEV